MKQQRRRLDHEKYESKWLGGGCGDRNDRWDVCWCWLSQKIDWTSAWMRCKVECLISFELHLSSCGWTRQKVVNDDFQVVVERWGVVLRLKLEVGTSWVICTKGGGLTSMNEIFTVVCSIVESVFEDWSWRTTERIKNEWERRDFLGGWCWVLGNL